ncbi:hypothetical protein [Brevibacillus centrosporus]|uniref:hypothetical protein n=1 Tax=Brevibacillus centrosporus TaxID=54910 RepID=UPI003808C6F4
MHQKHPPVKASIGKSSFLHHLPSAILFPHLFPAQQPPKNGPAPTIRKDGQLIRVLDIDSPRKSRFDEVDQVYLEQFVQALLPFL